MTFHWSLSDSKSSQVSRTRLRILAVLSNAVIWIVSTHMQTSKSSRPFNKPLVMCQKHQSQLVQSSLSCSSASSVLSQGWGTYPSFHILSVLFWGQPGQQSRKYCKFSFFLLIIIRSGLLSGLRWSVCMLKSHRSLWVPFSRTGAGLCIYHFNFLHISQWIAFPTQSCLALYSFCANLRHSLIMWLIVSSLSLHTLHLLFFFSLVYPRFDMIGSYGVVMCCF